MKIFCLSYFPFLIASYFILRSDYIKYLKNKKHFFDTEAMVLWLFLALIPLCNIALVLTYIIYRIYLRISSNYANFIEAILLIKRNKI